ncbi:MAG TPA: ABC transporter substrate-binding protein [Terriglobales bacterium]|nr:ABC transporter substrate-binding protein [Terriglobales bacterium]
MRRFAALIPSVLISFLVIPASAQSQVVRAGSFANITHAQALVGKANGTFARALGPDLRIEWKTFNAGPSAIEALFAGALDLAYIGPNPALTGYIRSRGEALRVIAGATSGGAALVVRADSGILRPADFHGKRVASPQLANTQDVALRAWLRSQGLKPRTQGGDVEVLPIANADQLNLFLKKQLDAAWAPEPWASRLIREAHARVFLDERQLWPEGRFATALLVVRTGFLHDHPELVRKWVAAHVELTDWINQHLPQARQVINQQIKTETGMALSPAVIEDAFARLQITYDPVRSSLLTSARWEFEAGFLGRSMPDLSGLCDLSILNQVLRNLQRKEVQ